MVRARGAVEEMIRARAAVAPGDTWLVWGSSTFTWEQTLSHVRRAANGLLEIGVRPGDRVALMLRNGPEFVWLHLAIQLIGAHSVPVNTSQRGVVLEHILGDSDASAVIFDEDLRDVVRTVAGRLPTLARLVVADGRAGGGVLTDVDRLLAAADVEPDLELQEATGGIGMLYTSGTTGPPKGVVSTGYDMAPVEELLRVSGVRPGETMYTGLPLFHGNALIVSMLGSIMLGAKLALAPRFTASGTWSDCRRHGAVTFNALGGMISILLKQPPSAADRDHPVRVVLSAGCPADRWREFEDRFGVRIIEWFGMVDSPGILLNADGKVGSMGRSGVAGVEFDVVDEHGRPAGPGRVGELVFRHPRGILSHYHRLPDATADAHRGGWFHTGDLAEVDAEGYFYYRGRQKESIRRLGENITAWEIETVLDRHPAVLASAAHAVPSELGEDEVKVCVVVRPGARMTQQEVVDFCAGRTAPHAVPRYVEFVDSLPRTATERIRHAVLRDRGVTPQTWDRDAIRDGGGPRPDRGRMGR